MLQPSPEVSVIRLDFMLIALTACGGGGNTAPPDAGPDATPPTIDAAADAPPPEPMPAFIVDGFTTGQLAVDDVGIRDTFTAGGQMFLSHIDLFLTETGATQSCMFSIRPAFVGFDQGTPSNRFFKTVQYDVAASTVLVDQCHFDDAYVLAEVKNQYGLAEVGWARARFDSDRPNLDVFLDADKTFPGQTDSIVRAGGGVGFAMAADGTVDEATLVEPVGGTLDRAVYQW
jgi:hypothetical protein